MTTRRLAAIMAADVVGYSRLMGADEEGTLGRLKRHRADLIDPEIADHRGRIVKTTGDGILVEFASAVDAVRCAVEIQERMAERNAGVPDGARIVFRVGINLGDVIVDGEDIHGDGVNVAARLEAQAAAGGIVLSGAVHEAVSGRVRATFEDLGDLSLKNIERPVRAYRWRVERIVEGPPAALPRPIDAPLALPDKPSIAVLPFQNMSGDPEQEYFVDGLVEDIITALSRFKSLFVIARNSSFTYKGKAVDIKLVGRELGVRYVLEGSVRKAGGRVRITGQLIECGTGAHLWADRFDGDLADVFDLQDHIAANVVGAIAPMVEQAEVERARGKPTGHLQAYDIVLRSEALVRSRFGGEMEQAIGDLRQAIKIDPNYARGLASLAHACLIYVSEGHCHRDDPAVADLVSLAQRALARDPADAEVLRVAGYVNALMCGNMKTGQDLIEKAVSVNPNDAESFRMGAVLYGYLGEVGKAVDYLQRADRLSPLASRGVNLGYVIAYFGSGQYDAVLDWTARSLSKLPNHAPSLRYRAASLALLGRVAEARQVVDRLLAKRPDYTVAEVRRHHEFDLNSPFKKPGVSDSLYRGLRLAGLPD